MGGRIMHIFIFSVFYIFAVICKTYGQGPILDNQGRLTDGVGDDFCVDRAFQRWHITMVTKFNKYADFISTMPTSRNLFQALFTQDFTTDSFKTFCGVHEETRKLYDKCPDTDAENVADIGFALADHVCIKRVETFSRNIPCLQQSNLFAFDRCKNSCLSFEAGSRRYIYPSQAELSDARMNWLPFMASDCLYLKCMTDCRKPLFEQKCSSTAAALEKDALKAAFAKKIDYYDPPWARSAARDSFMVGVVFPTECEQLADDATQTA